MKARKFFSKTLIIILTMAVGIGVIGALSVRNAKTTEEENAHPSSYLTNQRRHDIDMKELARMTGNYSYGGLQLLIAEEAHDQGPYLALSGDDCGFEGKIMYLQDGIVIVEVDQALYVAMPDGWKLESEDTYAILDYSMTGSGIELGYRGNIITFTSD